jgi:hypothetical protein
MFRMEVDGMVLEGIRNAETIAEVIGWCMQEWTGRGGPKLVNSLEIRPVKSDEAAEPDEPGQTEELDD